MSMSTVSIADELLFERQGGIVRLTLNRPEKRNALSRTLLTNLRAAQQRIAEDTGVRVAGKVFCAGHDLRACLEIQDWSFSAKDSIG